MENIKFLGMAPFYQDEFLDYIDMSLIFSRQKEEDVSTAPYDMNIDFEEYVPDMISSYVKRGSEQIIFFKDVAAHTDTHCGSKWMFVHIFSLNGNAGEFFVENERVPLREGGLYLFNGYLEHGIELNTQGKEPICAFAYDSRLNDEDTLEEALHELGI